MSWVLSYPRVGERKRRDLPSFNVGGFQGGTYSSESYVHRCLRFSKRIIKGRSISALMVASIYAACREANVPRTLDEIAQTVNTECVYNEHE
jgi:transcription factor TFIIB-like protein